MNKTKGVAKKECLVVAWFVAEFGKNLIQMTGSLMNCNVSSSIFLLTSLGRFSSPYNKSCVRTSFERLAYPNGRNIGRISARRLQEEFQQEICR